MITRPEQKFCADVDGALLIGAHVNRGVPIEAQLLLAIFGKRLDRPTFVGEAIHPANLTALRLGIDISGIAGIREHPETVTAEHIFPARVTYAAGVRGVSYPGAVVLQPTVNMVGVIVIHADVVKLRNRQVDLVLPARAAIFAAPKPAVISGIDSIRVVGINPDIVKVAVSSLRDRAETAAAVYAEQ